MILEKQSEGLILEEGAISESTVMEIDAESHIFLMRMLSKFYSDNIGSPIRETASNALDSHRNSGTTDPIIIKLSDKSGQIEFSVEDFGSGINTHIVDTVIRKYGKSTKRNDAKALGAFGLGFKSPLAYSPSFCFIGRKNGIERKWMMYEAEEEENKIDLLYEQPTTERDGVKVIMSIKYNDRYSFINKIKEQLAYFESVYFDVPGIDNNFKILRDEHFQYSELCTDPEMHICLDNVYYPIDWNKLGIPTIYLPIGLKFSLSDGIFPLPNRETLKYTESAKKTILAKIGAIADQLITEYNKNVSDSDDINAIFAFLGSQKKQISKIPGVVWDVTCLSSYSKIKFKEPQLKSLKYLKISDIYTMRENLAKRYIKNIDYRNGRFKSLEERGWQREMQFYNFNDNIYIYSESLNKVKKDYLKSIIGNKYATFVKYKGHYPLKGKNASDPSYFSILRLKTVPKDKWRLAIQDFQYVQGLFTKNFINADLEVPKVWLEDRKKKRLQILAAKGVTARRKKLTGEVTGKEARPLGRYVSGKNCKFEAHIIQMKDAHKDKKLTVYGNQENEPKIQGYFEMFKHSKIRFMIFSERELKNLKDVDLHNWISMEEFEKGKHIIFRRAVTAYLIKDLIDKNSATFLKVAEIGKISKDLADKLNALLKYRREFYINGNEALFADMVKVAEDNKLFDPISYSLYKEVSKTIEKVPFLNAICSVMPNYDTKEKTAIIESLKDLFKYYKMRIDWIHYKVILNEDPKEELKEEEIEEIV